MECQNKFKFDWLNNNPHKWHGKQVCCKKTGATYTVHDVLNDGSVVLEKRWVLYMSHVEIIRQDYVPAGP